VFNHKSTKPAFRRYYWLSVALNVACLAWLASHGLLAAANFG